MRTVFLGFAVAALSVALRVPVLLKIEPTAFGGENDRVARALASGRGWSDVYGDATGPTAHVPPVYPLILQSLYRVFGTYETLSGRVAQQSCSLAVSVVVILLLPAVARRLGLPAAVGWSAAFLASWLPAHRWHHVTGFDQGLAALLLFAVIVGCAALRDRGWQGSRFVLTFGVLLGIAALAAPNFLAAPLLFMLAELFRRRGERERVLRAAVSAGIVAAVVVAPWAIRNAVALGGFVPLRSNFGLELAIGNRPGADGHTYASGFYDLHPLGSPRERERVTGLGELGYMREKQADALAWMADHPGDFARLTLRRVYLFWFVQNDKWYRFSPTPMLGSRVYGLLGICLAIEMIRLLRRGHPAGPLLTCFVFGLGLPYFVTHVEARYTVPFVNLAALATCSLGWTSAQELRCRWRLFIHQWRAGDANAPASSATPIAIH
jgi:hypothetical protein